MFKSLATQLASGKKLAHGILLSCVFVATGASELCAAPVSPDRSLLITDNTILDAFTLTDVVQKLLNDSGDNSTPQALFDTLSAEITACDTDRFNNLPERCSRQVLKEVDDYRPIAIINRFDLADSDGEHCGEYRIAFEQNVEPIADQKNFVIFEARLQNANQEDGVKGCLPIAKFWQSLSHENNMETRASLLWNFYFNGIENFDAVINVHNFAGGENQSGQVRVNQRHHQRTTWSLFELRFEPHCNNGVCSINGLQSTVKDNPFERLASSEAELADDPEAQNLVQVFQDAVVQSIPLNGNGKLLAQTMSTLAMDLPNDVNIGRGFGDNFSGSEEGISAFFDPQGDFADALRDRLNLAESTLTPEQIISRVDALSCGGCHNQADDLGGNLNLDTASQALEFLSVDPSFGPNGEQRFFVKPAMQNIFLPERKTIIETFLAVDGLFIEAESFDNMSGIQLEDANDVGQGQNVGWTDAGDWMEYALTLPQSDSGQYEISYRVASETGGAFNLLTGVNGNVLDSVNVSTGGWQNWQTITQTVSIPAGTNTLVMASISGAWNLNWFEIQPLGTSCTSNCNPSIIKVEAESYSEESGTEIEDTSDEGLGQNVGWLDAGDWMSYPSVTVPVSGTYRVKFRVASNASNGVLQFERAGGAPVYGQLSVPNTGGWQNWTTIEMTLALPEGPYRFGFFVPQGGWNINWFSLELVQ